MAYPTQGGQPSQSGQHPQYLANGAPIGTNGHPSQQQHFAGANGLTSPRQGGPPPQWAVGGAQGPHGYPQGMPIAHPGIDPVAFAAGARSPGMQVPAQYGMYTPQQGGTQHLPQMLPSQPQGQAAFANSAQYAAYAAQRTGEPSPGGVNASQWVSTVPTSTSTQPLRSGAQPQGSFPMQSQQQQRLPQHVLQQMQAQQPLAGAFAGIAQPQQRQMQSARPAAIDPYQQAYGQSSKQEPNDVGDEEVDDNDEDGDVDGLGRRGKSQKGASEFVKKLFRMLDDTSYATIVSWSPSGDSFIVRDMNDFTKHVLPRHFRHSNFASFVRQLNKYDFHKVKKPEEQGQPQQLGVEQQWEFQHPAFLQGREDLLDNVRRKVPAAKKGMRKEDGGSREQSPSMPALQEAAERGAQEYTMLKDQVATLTQSQDHMSSHINNLTKQYQAVIGEMLTFQKNMVQQDQLMQNLIQYLMSLESDRSIEGQRQGGQQQSQQLESQGRTGQINGNGAFVSGGDAGKLVTNFADVAKESFAQMSNLAQRANSSGNADADSSASLPRSSNPQIRTTGTSMSTSVNTPVSPKSSHSATPRDYRGKERESFDLNNGIHLHPPHHEADEPASDLFSAAASALDNPSLAGFEDAGLRVFTVGTLQPREDVDATDASALHGALRSVASGQDQPPANMPYGIDVPNLERLPSKMPRVDQRTTSMATPRRPSEVEANARESSTLSDGGNNMLRVRRSTYVPGWAVPPKVLVVDDDDVCRKLGSKFLQVFGCAIDVAVDGVTAVNKMNLEKYDLVLMDIVMPNLDGVSATSLIREFDARTPIISMTSNSGPNELMSYMKSGMNDVLPKPFTKEGLLGMLEKHLIHLKTVQKMDEIPRALGLPPVSDSMMQSVLEATAASAQSVGGAGMLSPGANPMAALMGNGPEMMRASQEASERRSASDGPHSGSVSGLFAGDAEDDAGVNPLAGMGFSDEEYISMLQNLIAAGSVSDGGSRNETTDLVANVMGVTRGEGTFGGTRSKENTPLASGDTSKADGAGKTRKRTATSEIDELGPKKSRFTELTS